MLESNAMVDDLSALCHLINRLFELEQSIARGADRERLDRNMKRVKEVLSDSDIVYDTPFGESFTETRTDVEAHISGEGIENLKIIDVLKPIIRHKAGGRSQIVQKGVVVVQSAPERTHDE